MRILWNLEELSFVIRRRILEKMPEFSQGQLRIARFFLENPRSAAFLTALEVAEKVGVSESTVVRFASALGYRGYPELRKALQEILAHHLTTLERLQNFREEPEEKEKTLLEQALLGDAESLRTALVTVDYGLLGKLAEYVATRERVLLVGRRSAFSLAHYLWYYLHWFLPRISLLEGEIFPETLLENAPQTLVLGITLPRYTRETVEALKLARQAGATTAAITDSVLSPIGEAADLVITVPSQPMAFIDSFVPTMSVLNALLLLVAEKLGRPYIKKRLAYLEEIWKNQQVYCQD